MHVVTKAFTKGIDHPIFHFVFPNDRMPYGSFVSDQRGHVTECPPPYKDASHATANNR